jgi:hypothetical protein
MTNQVTGDTDQGGKAPPRHYEIVRGPVVGVVLPIEPGERVSLTGCSCVCPGGKTEGVVGAYVVRCAGCGALHARAVHPPVGPCASHRLVRLPSGAEITHVYACLDCDLRATEGALEEMAAPWFIIVSGFAPAPAPVSAAKAAELARYGLVSVNGKAYAKGFEPTGQSSIGPVVSCAPAPTVCTREQSDALSFAAAIAFCEPGEHRSSLEKTMVQWSEDGVLIHCHDALTLEHAKAVLAGARLRFDELSGYQLRLLRGLPCERWTSQRIVDVITWAIAKCSGRPDVFAELVANGAEPERAREAARIYATHADPERGCGEAMAAVLNGQAPLEAPEPPASPQHWTQEPDPYVSARIKRLDDQVDAACPGRFAERSTTIAEATERAREVLGGQQSAWLHYDGQAARALAMSQRLQAAISEAGEKDGGA